jgi:hypothetical protein
VPFAETLHPFFADFGVDGTLAGVQVRVVFDTAAANSFAGAGMVAAEPQVTIATACVPAAPHGADLVIPQGRYVVREHLPDGTGVSLLTLTRAA